VISLHDVSAIVTAWAAKDDQIDAAWLFGSIVRGRNHESSDVDVAVLPRRGVVIDAVTRLDMAVELGARIQRNVDLVFLDTAGELLAAQVLRSGIRVFVRNPTRVHLFELAEAGKYSDYSRLTLSIISTRKRQLHGRP